MVGAAVSCLVIVLFEPERVFEKVVTETGGVTVIVTGCSSTVLLRVTVRFIVTSDGSGVIVLVAGISVMV